MQAYVECGDGGLTGRAPAALLDRSEGSGPLDPLVDALLSAMPGHVAVLDREGIILAVNQAWGHLAGASDASGPIRGNIGANYLALLRRTPRSLQDYARDATRGIRSVLAGEQSQFTLEYAYPPSTRQRWFVMRASALPGSVGAALVSHVDISERKRTEEERAQLVAREQAARSEAEQSRAAAQAAQKEADAVREAAEARTAQLQAIIDSMTDCVVVFDRELRIVQTNAAGAALFGVESHAGALSGTLWQRLLALRMRDSEGRRLTKKQMAFARIARGETVAGPRTQDFALRTAAGEELVVSASCSPVRDAEGRITGGVAVLRDVTQRRRLEREVNERANTLATLVEAMADGVIITDDHGRIVHANQAYSRLIAVNALPGFLKRTSPMREYLLRMRDDQGVPLLPAQLPTNILLGGKVLQGSTATDIRMRALDGRELELNVSGTPLRDGTGRVIGTVSVLRDVTERRALERRTHQALEALVAMAHIVVGPGSSLSGQEAETSTSAATPQRLAELTLAALGCESAGILALEADSDVLRLMAVASTTPWAEPAWRNSYRRVPRLAERFGPHTLERLYADEVVTFEMEQLHRGRTNGAQPNRESRKVSWLIAPLSAGGRLIGLLRLDFGREPHGFSHEELALAGAVGKLATLALERERLRREQEEARANELAARQVSQQMDEFLAIASHDLRQPATSGSGYVQLAARRFKRLALEVDSHDEAIAGQFQAVESNLARAGESLERLSNLVSSLFDVSRIRAGQFEIDSGPADLLSIVREIVEEQRVAAPARRIYLGLPGESTVPVVADPLRIGQVLTNYLGNALRYSPEEHSIEVALRVEAQQARVSVRDEGPGIQPEELNRIWRRFERSRERDGGDNSSRGIGLGLYISREIIERHGGEVGVHSVVGQGSTFWFTLPLAPHSLDAQG